MSDAGAVTTAAAITSEVTQMPNDKDIVVEAREFLSRLPDKPYNLIEHDTIFNFYLAAPDLLRALADEVERLRKDVKGTEAERDAANAQYERQWS